MNLRADVSIFKTAANEGVSIAVKLRATSFIWKKADVEAKKRKVRVESVGRNSRLVERNGRAMELEKQLVYFATKVYIAESKYLLPWGETQTLKHEITTGVSTDEDMEQCFVNRMYGCALFEGDDVPNFRQGVVSWCFWIAFSAVSDFIYWESTCSF